MIGIEKRRCSREAFWVVGQFEKIVPQGLKPATDGRYGVSKLAP